MTKNETRWRTTWSLLSLDQSTSFFSDLWLWVDAPARFQAKLRNEMRPWLSSADTFFDAAGEFEYALSVWFVREFGPERFWYLSDWVRRILLAEGPDRLAETFWSEITYNIWRTPPQADDLSPTVYSAIAGLCEAHQNRHRQLEERIAEACGRPLSAWDHDLLRLSWDETAGDWEGHVESTTNKISLIGSYNSFLEGWDRRCAHLTLPELRQLHRVGKRIAKRLSMGEDGNGEQIEFPGSWQPEARRFLQRLPSSTV